MDLSQEKTYTAKELASIFRCNIKSIYKLVTHGKLRAVRLNSSLRFLDSDVKKFISNRK